MKTRSDAREYLIAVIEAGAATQDEFDLEAVLDEIYREDLASGWDLDSMESETFWDLVKKHAIGGE